MLLINYAYNASTHLSAVLRTFGVVKNLAPVELRFDPYLLGAEACQEAFQPMHRVIVFCD
jgi:hypothetical protein